MTEQNQHIDPDVDWEAELGTPEDRDSFLRAVVTELQPGNERWPGLWTRLDSLLRERDSLVEQLEAAHEALRAIVKIDATSSYMSIYTCPTEMAGIARAALNSHGSVTNAPAQDSSST